MKMRNTRSTDRIANTTAFAGDKRLLGDQEDICPLFLQRYGEEHAGLQQAIAILREADLGLPLQFVNFRD